MLEAIECRRHVVVALCVNAPFARHMSFNADVLQVIPLAILVTSALSGSGAVYLCSSTGHKHA